MQDDDLPRDLDADHDRSAMRVVSTKIPTLISPQFLKTDPDVGLDILHQVSQVNWAIGIGKSGSHQDLALSHSTLHLLFGIVFERDSGFDTSLDGERTLAWTKKPGGFQKPASIQV